MTITLLPYSGDKNALNKVFGTGQQMTGYTLTDPSEVVTPIIRIDSRQNETGGFDPTNYNMAYIDEFQRYYWITDMRTEDNYIWRIYLRSDPLSSFASQISSLDAYCLRTSNPVYQSYEVVDPDAPMKAHNWVRNFKINELTEPSTNILITAG